MRKLFAACLLFVSIFSFRAAVAQSDSHGPVVLVVTAHPDDEVMFATTMYRITHSLGGDVDIALMTDGAGGYRFSTLSESIYGRELTDPEVARNYLPAIRKKELMAAGEIAGIRNFYFMEQPDLGKTQDQDSILTYVWDREFAAGQLDNLLAKGDYDFVFTHLPIKPFHSHHKAATVLAVEAVNRMDPGDRPIILGSFTTGGLDEAVAEYRQLEGHPLTKIFLDGPFVFDKNTPLGLDGRLNYNIIANWMIAEYKSQGTMQLLVQDVGVERFWVYEMNGSDALGETDSLMEQVRTAPF